jgi:hypothetical protein
LKFCQGFREARPAMSDNDGYKPRLPSRIIEIVPIALVVCVILYWIYTAY